MVGKIAKILSTSRGVQIKMINAGRCNKNENSRFRKRQRGNVDC